MFGKIAESTSTVQFDSALLQAAHDAACTKFPTLAARIDAGLQLALNGSVEDCTHLRPRWYTVTSRRQPDLYYDVVSNGETVCNCPDYEFRATQTNGYVCTHGWAVLLVRWVKKHSPIETSAHYAHLYDEPGILTYVHHVRTFFGENGTITHIAPEMEPFLTLLGHVSTADAQQAEDGDRVRFCSQTVEQVG